MDPEPNQEPNAPATASEAEGSPGPLATSSAVPETSDDDELVPASSASAPRRGSTGVRSKAGAYPNNVKKLRQRAMMSKAELARRAGVSPLTIDRVEAGCPCRMDTKRKILEALGLDPTAGSQVFPDVDLG